MRNALVVALALALPHPVLATPWFDSQYSNNDIWHWYALQCGANQAYCPTGCTQENGDHTGYACPTSATPDTLTSSACAAPGPDSYGSTCRVFVENKTFDGTNRPYLRVRANNADDYSCASGCGRNEVVGYTHCENSDTCNNAEDVSEYYYWTTYVPAAGSGFPANPPPSAEPTWAAIFQFHTNFDSACAGTYNPLGILIDDQYCDAGGHCNGTGTRQWAMGIDVCEDDDGTCKNEKKYFTPLTYAHLYHFVLYVKWSKFSSEGHGHVTLWMDGAKVFDENVKTLWTQDQCGGNASNAEAYHWKQGIYHDDQSAMDNMILWHGDMKVSTDCNDTPLKDACLCPLPPPPTPAVKTYYIDQNLNYAAGTCYPALGAWVDDTSAMVTIMAADGWSGPRYTDPAAYPQDFMETCGGNGGLDASYADTKLLAVISGYGNPEKVKFAYPHGGRCDLYGSDMKLGKKGGALAGYLAAMVPCFMNVNVQNWEWGQNDYVWQLMGIHSLLSDDGGMTSGFINSTKVYSNRISWLNTMEDRPGWFTGDNSPIIHSFGANNSAEDRDDTHYNAKLMGLYKAYSRGAPASCCSDDGQGWILYELRDHGDAGCY